MSDADKPDDDAPGSGGADTRQALLPVDKIRRNLMRVLIFLFVVGLASELAADQARRAFEDRPYWAQMFSMSYEVNVPTWFSASMHVVCAAFLVGITCLQKRSGGGMVGYWAGLAAIFFYISLDESISIHEHAGGLLESGGGFLYFDWVIPAAFVVGIIGLLYLRFLWRLPKRTRVQFIVAGAIFVGGAMGVELFLGYWTDLYGTKNLGYSLIDLIEETMEMLGMVLFLCALLEVFNQRAVVVVRGMEGDALSSP